MEQWKQIQEFPNYDCSDNGKIRNRTTGRISYGRVDSKGYIAVSISINGKRKIIHPHRIVAKLFVQNPNEKPFVNHIDGNKVNNSYRNLEWCTHKENIRHASEILKKPFGKAQRKKVRCIETGEIFNSGCDVEKIMHICNSHISNCCHGKRKTAGGYHFEFV